MSSRHRSGTSHLRLVWRLANYIFFRARSRPSARNHVFVLGAPRSGTSLLETVIVRHSKFFSVGQETGFFTPNFVLDAGKRWGGLRGDIIRDLNGQSLTQLFDRFAETTLLKQNALNGIFVEKTPQHVLYIKFLLWAYPNARIINILRDPRDCFASTRNHPGICNWTSLRYAKYHNRCVDARIRAGKNAQILDVHYSCFVREPESEITRIMKFLGVCFEPEQLDARTVEHDKRATRVQFSRLSKPILPSSDGTWSKRISPEDAYTIEKISGARLELSVSPFSLNTALEYVASGSNVK